MTPVRLTPEQERVYLLLREGSAQSLVAKKTGLRKGTISKIARKLTAEGFLVRATDKQPYLYGDGPRSQELDKIIGLKRVSKSTSDEVSTHATSVGNLSSETSAVRTVLSHHVKVRFKVEKIGDTEVLRFKDSETGASYETPFLEQAPYFDHNNIRRTKGKLLFSGSQLSVELEETPSCSWFYIHLPKVSLTREDLESNKWEEIYKRIGQEAGNHLQKWGGWKLGLMELCPNWKPHFAAEDPRILQTIVGRFSAKNGRGDVWTSDSEGRRELETSRPELASVICDLPGAVYELRLTVSEILQVLDMMVLAEEKVAEVEAARLQRETNMLGVNGIGR